MLQVETDLHLQLKVAGKRVGFNDVAVLGAGECRGHVPGTHPGSPVADAAAASGEYPWRGG